MVRRSPSIRGAMVGHVSASGVWISNGWLLFDSLRWLLSSPTVYPSRLPNEESPVLQPSNHLDCQTKSVLTLSRKLAPVSPYFRVVGAFWLVAERNSQLSPLTAAFFPGCFSSPQTMGKRIPVFYWRSALPRYLNLIYECSIITMIFPKLQRVSHYITVKL
jgi:hypothetical protein